MTGPRVPSDARCSWAKQEQETRGMKIIQLSKDNRNDKMIMMIVYENACSNHVKAAEGKKKTLI